jgi:hypothetical protein
VGEELHPGWGAAFRTPRRLQELFEQQPASEKRKFLKFVVSNSTWKDGNLTVEYRQLFDLFAT